MANPENDPSIWSEPHLRGGAFRFDPTEPAAAERLGRESRRENEDDRVEHSVWDEPTLSGELVNGAPRDGLTYAEWIERRSAGVTVGKSWAVALAASLAAGPWAVLGALLTGHPNVAGPLTAIFVAPLTEEIMKVALALFLVERRPYLFRSPAQILVCGLIAALAFAAMENALYLYVYIPEHSSLLAWWRWTICTGLHVSCTLIASAGLVRIWRRAVPGRRRPELSLASPFLVAAMIVHGAYNAFALVLEHFLPF